MTPSNSDHVEHQRTTQPRRLANRIGPRLCLCLSLAGALVPAAAGARPGSQGSSPSDGTPIEEPEFVPGRMATSPESLAAPEATSAAVALRRTRALKRFLDRGAARGLIESWRLGPYHEPLRQLPNDVVVGPARGGPRPGSEWGPYSGAWTRNEASHLLHRAMIGARFDEVRAAALAGQSATVAQLLKQRPKLPNPPAPWANEPFPDITNWSDDQIDSLFKEYWDRRDPLRLWWVKVMLNEPVSAREAMTLFWHDHFATGVSKVQLPQSMYVQNQLFRRQALGNFKTLVKEVARDPAMLIWLDGIDNRAGYTNENFARELLELFTMGVNNYTQDDVVAASRAFTGWTTIDGLKGIYVPEWHDNGMKTFLGRTGRWTGDDIVNIIFQHPATARFLCRKLYKYFLDEYPDEAAVESLAKVLRANNYEIRPVLQRMLLSTRFMDPNYRGALVSDPIDRTVGSMRTLRVEGIDFVVDHPEWHPEGAWTLYSMDVLGQMLFEPPNVGGWPGYRNWLNSLTLPWRKTLDVGLVDGDIDGFDLSMQSNVIALANDLTNPNDAEALVDDLALDLFGQPPTEAVRQRMLDELLQGAEPWEWSLYYPEAEARLRGLVRLALRLPDVQLK